MTAALLLLGFGAGAQNVSDLVITEAVCENTSGPVDGYGRHSSWIEITNSSQGTVNYAGCFLTDDPAVPNKYMIPKGDASTKAGPRQTFIIWMGCDDAEGTFYSSIPVTRGGCIYLVSNDGKTIIDSIAVPEDLPEDMSVAKIARDNKGMQFITEEEAQIPSFKVINVAGSGETGAQKAARTDPHGWILTLTSVSVVFGALIVLWFIFSLVGRVFSREKKAPAAAKPDEMTAAAIALALDMEEGGGTYAAIAMALHLYLGESIHDKESFIITIKPTTAKHDNFRKLPR